MGINRRAPMHLTSHADIMGGKDCSGGAAASSSSTVPSSVPAGAAAGASSGRPTTERPGRRRVSDPCLLADKKGAQTGKKLSFVNCTLEQIQESMLKQDNGLNISMSFWQPLLSGQPSAKFKPLKNRTLTFWVDCFNKWQEQRRVAKKEASSATVNVSQFLHIIFLSKTNLAPLLELFNPEGAKLLASSGHTPNTLAKINVPILDIITVGVLSSGLIATLHKLRFFMCLADHNDTRSIDEGKFLTLTKAFVRGFGMMFLAPATSMPTDAALAKVARNAFKRIFQVTKHDAAGDGAGLDAAASGGSRAGSKSGAAAAAAPASASAPASAAAPGKLRSTTLGSIGSAIAGGGGGGEAARTARGPRAAIDGSALSGGHAAALSARGGDSLARSAPAGSSGPGVTVVLKRTATNLSSSYSSEKDGDREPGEAVPYEAAIDWFLGSLLVEDSTATPFRFVVQRFCPTRHRDISDEFDSSLHAFTLSHSKAIDVAQISATPAGCKVMTRKEVVLARDFFEYAQKCHNFRLDPADNELGRMMKQRNWRVDTDVKHHLKRAWYIEALAKLAEACERQSSDPDKFGFLEYLRALCPSALPKHLRMYEVWCMDYDAMKEEQDQLLHLQEAKEKFLENQKKPFLPEEQVSAIRRQFAEIDIVKHGLITREAMKDLLGLSEEACRATFDTFDVSCDGFIDEDEFLRMMCPSEFRLREMGGFARDIFGRVLICETERLGGSLESMQSKYLQTPKNAPQLSTVVPPSSALPPVAEEDLRQWNEVFDGLDTDDDDRVRIKDLECSGLLSSAVCTAVAELIDPDDTTGFTREGFLEMLARAHGVRYKRQGPSGLLGLGCVDENEDPRH